MDEHEIEPVPGLPQRLPPGERILWQGAPSARALLRRAMRARAPAVYFALLLVWFVGTKLRDGGAPVDALLAGLLAVALALGTLAAAALFCWMTARSTVFTLTSRRLVVRTGIALSLAVNIPLGLIDTAGLRCDSDGSGDIALRLLHPHYPRYLALFPYVKLWRVTRVAPLLRGVANAAEVAGLLAAALAATAEAPAATTRAAPRVVAAGHAVAA